MTKRTIVPKTGAAERLPDDNLPIEIGQWYWVDGQKDDHDKPIDWLGCVMELGSNYAELHNPFGSFIRIHFDKFPKICHLEPDPESVLKKEADRCRAVVREKLGEIKAVTARLGLDPRRSLEYQTNSCRALSTLSSADDIPKYKRDLIRAKDKTLPVLFAEVKEAHEELATWLTAQAMPMKALADGMEGAIDEIKDRVFNVTLYAGLTEEVAQFADGTPAAAGEKLRIFQRMLFMDEECLLDYRHGGMEFKKIRDFDRWLAEPKNRDRILPFPRSMVAFRVRRNEKERDWGGDFMTAWINFQLKELDKRTFLYIRNGDRLYRMDCDLEFGELIFPSRHELNLSEPMIAKVSFNKIEEIVPRRQYDDMVKQEEERKKKYKEWGKANPKKHRFENPFFESKYDFGSSSQWEPFDDRSVHFDEMRADISNRVKHYNRIAVIVQGLFDRSDVLHPHPSVSLWNAGGFSSAVELVYDGSDTIHYGEAPDFERYHQQCNVSLKEGSVTIGQDDAWQEREAKIENARRDRSWRSSDHHRELDRFTPYGDPGPGLLARIVTWKARARVAVFRWERKRRTWNTYKEDPIACAIAVPADRLFNVDAYKPGDYRQFFVDPRTRARYLQWAPLLLTAEEYKAGNEKVWKKHRV